MSSEHNTPYPTRTSSSDAGPLDGVIGTYRLLRHLGEGGMARSGWPNRRDQSVAKSR
jgi:hypothetical protein